MQRGHVCGRSYQFTVKFTVQGQLGVVFVPAPALEVQQGGRLTSAPLGGPISSGARSAAEAIGLGERFADIATGF